MSPHQDDSLSTVTHSISLENHDHEQLQKHKSMVIEQLGRMNDAYLDIWNHLPYPENPLAAFNQVKLRQAHVDRLRSSLLPALRRLATTFLQALLDALTLQRDALSQLKLILETLSEINIVVHEVKCSLAMIDPGIRPLDASHDGDYRHAKSFVCSRFASEIYSLVNSLCQSFRTSVDLLEGFGQVGGDGSPAVECTVHKMTTSFCDLTDAVIEFMKQSELQILQSHWQPFICRIDETLLGFVKNHRNNSKEEQSIDAVGRQVSQPETRIANLDDENSRSETSPTRSQSDKDDLASLTIAIIKVSRLLLIKLFRISKNKETFILASNMPSIKLELFLTSSQMFAESIEDFAGPMYHNPDNLTLEDIYSNLENAVLRLNAASQYMLGIIDHVLPPFVHLSNQLSPETNPKVWFHECHQLLHSATHDLLKGIQLFLPSPSTNE